jgi:hypothetical protein
VDPTTLLCTTDDPMSDLWPTPQQLLQVRLAGPLTGVDTTAEVTSLGQPAMESLCQGTFEVEGIDYSAITGDLLIVVVPPKPCRLWTTIYQYRKSP